MGDRNDYVGKGPLGRRIIVRRAETLGSCRTSPIIVGNTVLYGRDFGECYFNGVAGEPLCRRNSGAIAVVEGSAITARIHDRGVVVVLGGTGPQLRARMSGGVAYVLDERATVAGAVTWRWSNCSRFRRRTTCWRSCITHGGDLMHKGMVDVSGDMTRHDEERLYQLISNHLHYTGSVRAKEILDRWADYRPKFRQGDAGRVPRALEDMERMKMAEAAE